MILWCYQNSICCRTLHCKVSLHHCITFSITTLQLEGNASVCWCQSYQLSVSRRTLVCLGCSQWVAYFQPDFIHEGNDNSTYLFSKYTWICPYDQLPVRLNLNLLISVYDLTCVPSSSMSFKRWMSRSRYTLFINTLSDWFIHWLKK